MDIRIIQLNSFIAFCAGVVIALTISSFFIFDFLVNLAITIFSVSILILQIIAFIFFNKIMREEE